MGIQTASPLYLVNTTTVDTGAGIDVRLLDSAQAGADDDTQTATATHTQDNVERTFDPATGGVTNTNNANTTMFKLGYALRLAEDATPPINLIADSSVYGLHGRTSGSPSLIAAFVSGFTNAVSFSGTDADDNSDGISAVGVSTVGLSAFTFEVRLRRDSVTRNETVAQWGAYIGGTFYGLFFTQTNTGLAGLQYFENDVLIYATATSGSTGTGNHAYAATWDGSNLRFHVDGVHIASSSFTTLYASALFELWVGRGLFDPTSPAAGSPRASDVAVDEIRISNSARYTSSNYTVDTAPFAADANTRLLWHFDDWLCKTAVLAGTHAVSLACTINQAGGTYTGGTYGPTWKASLWRYNPATDTGTLIGSGSSAATTWDYTPATGDLGTFKTVTFDIVLGSTVQLEPGETLMMQVGLNTGTIPNPSIGTATWTYTLRADNTNTKITWDAAGGVRQLCSVALDSTGIGTADSGTFTVEEYLEAVGVGTADESHITSALITLDATGIGTADSVLTVTLDPSNEGLEAVGIGTADGRIETDLDDVPSGGGAGSFTRELSVGVMD